MLSSLYFQAEDGIRDDLVTGVQTCALPIWFVLNAREARWLESERLGMYCGFEDEPRFAQLGINQIGRASCRVNMWDSGDRVIMLSTTVHCYVLGICGGMHR